MNGLAEGIQNAVQYIEDNLTEELNIDDIAIKAYVSSFHFQRIFSALCGFTVGEYIRGRRLSAAAQELSRSDAKVIDIALKYGYESHDSFTRAFTKFHGVSPSAAKENGAQLKSFAPLKIKLTLEGGTIMEYKIVKKAAFTVIGRSRRFLYENSYQEIPKFWQEHMKSPESANIIGMYGLSVDNKERDFEYYIADNYCPQKDIPDGYATYTLPAGLWAIFPCRGPMVDTLQSTNTRIWNEWLPNCREYKLVGNYNIEAYFAPTHNDPKDDYCEIWIPVEKI
ncbi:MAG: AraC family transcriptional regulator [Ruminococcaceae bacterium]|nr:AraC family transcriptional regulator [Oscillospiraceae bacterium]